MKLTKKQLSASYVTQATASTSLKEQAYPGGITKGDVANHRDSRLDRCSVASPPRQGRVHHTSQLRKTSGDKGAPVMYLLVASGPVKQPGVEITPLQMYVEEV